MVAPPAARITWPKYHRLINTAYPPIDLFEDIADPADWELLARAEGRTNPRLAETIGSLDLIPVDRRVNGDGASYVIAPFTLVSTDRQGRFHDGTFGAFYGSDSFEVALMETIHHQQQFFAGTSEEPGWICDMRELIGSVDADLEDLRGGNVSAILDPDDYTASHDYARDARARGCNGVVYPSVRQLGGQCFAAFYPDVMTAPIQGKQITYHWDGTRIDMIKDLSDNRKVYEVWP